MHVVEVKVPPPPPMFVWVGVIKQKIRVAWEYFSLICVSVFSTSLQNNWVPTIYLWLLVFLVRHPEMLSPLHPVKNVPRTRLRLRGSSNVDSAGSKATPLCYPQRRSPIVLQNDHLWSQLQSNWSCCWTKCVEIHCSGRKMWTRLSVLIPRKSLFLPLPVSQVQWLLLFNSANFRFVSEINALTLQSSGIPHIPTLKSKESILTKSNSYF